MADPTGADRRAAFPLGFAGEDLREEERPLPAGEPPPWPPNAELSVVGRPTPRLDGPAKVTGAARFTTDVRLRGMLHARRIVSSVPHGRILAVDTSRADKVPGVKAIHLLDRPAGEPVEREGAGAGSRWPVLRYVGQPIGAVAATTPEAAEEAARLVEVKVEALPFTVDMDQALAPGAPLVYPGAVDQRGSAGGGGAAAGLPQEGNRRGPARSERGDVARGFAEAEVVVEETFETQVQTHSALETHGLVAQWTEGGLVVWASTQGTAGVRDDLAEVFGLPREKVRVVTEFMGGGFGAKFGAGSTGILAAHLARKTGRPVRLVLDRREEHTSAGNRPATRQTLRIGARRDGTLTAVSLESIGTAGVGTGAGVGFVAERMYACPSFQGAQSDVFVHAGPGTAFRAPGVPQGIFALEQVVDELAHRLGMDPLALRDVIDTREESAAPARRVERRIGAERIGWTRRHAPGADPGPVKRGLGFAQSLWPRIVNLASNAEVAIASSGAVEVRSGVQDIGTGTRTALAQVVAEELGLRAEQVTVRIGDTTFPDGPASGGSNVTGSLTPAARTAAHRAGEELRARLARKLGVAPESLSFRGGKVVRRGGGGIPFAEAAALAGRRGIVARAGRTEDYGYPGKGWRGAMGGVQFAEVAVDVETGLVRVERIVAVHDCGRPVNPLAVRSQIEGGIQHGLSWALLEDRVLDRATGRMVNPNFDQYRIAGARETPRIEIHLLEEYRGRSATDASGIGEPANIATAAAVANAFHNATGVRMRELPMSPRRVLAALERAGRSP
jgi:xanthine dehydrogenase YagR molybdenum-binding subunit